MTTTKTMGLPPRSTRERLSRLADKLGLGKWSERLYPFLGGAVAAFLLIRAGIDKTAFDKLIKDVVPAALSIAAIFAGFQGAVHAILLSMLGSRVVRVLKRNKDFDRLIGFVRSGFATLIVFVVASMGVLVTISLGRFPDAAGEWTAAILLGLFAWSLLASVRITLLEVKLLHVHED